MDINETIRILARDLHRGRPDRAEKFFEGELIFSSPDEAEELRRRFEILKERLRRRAA